MKITAQNAAYPLEKRTKKAVPKRPVPEMAARRDIGTAVPLLRY